MSIQSTFPFPARAHVDENADPTVMPWDEDGFIPMTGTGKPKSPNQIRNELQKYIDNSSETQTAIVEHMGVNNNSFRKFMNPKTYKDQWSAVQNGTYWAAARLLEQHKYEQKMAKKTGNNKRKSLGDDNAGPTKKSKADAKAEMEAHMERVAATELPPQSFVYDSCPEMVKKIKEFLSRDGVTKAAFLRTIGNVNSNSMNRFLAAKKQDGCGNCSYPKSYMFFEKMRILENKAKTKKRLQNEVEHPRGFSVETPPTHTWVFAPRMM